jgi:hypothetical protein
MLLQYQLMTEAKPFGLSYAVITDNISFGAIAALDEQSQYYSTPAQE